jgi:hypothetical protein
MAFGTFLHDKNGLSFTGWGRFFLERPDARRSPERHTPGPTNRWPERLGRIET